MLCSLISALETVRSGKITMYGCAEPLGYGAKPQILSMDCSIHILKAHPCLVLGSRTMCGYRVTLELAQALP